MSDIEKQLIQQGKDEAILRSIRSLIQSLNFSIKQAMDALGIPAEEQPKYAAQI